LHNSTEYICLCNNNFIFEWKTMHTASRFYFFSCIFFVPTLTHCCVDQITLAEHKKELRKQQKEMKALAQQKLSKPVDAQELYDKLLLVAKYRSDVPKPEPKSKSLPSLPTTTKIPPTKREELLRPISILARPDEYSSGDERDALVSNNLNLDDFKNYQGSSDGSCDNLLNAPSSGESSDDDNLTSLERRKKGRARQKMQKTFSVDNRPPTYNVETSDKYNIQTSPSGIRRRHPTAHQKQPQYTKNKGD
jgi:hypothetical protein